MMPRIRALWSILAAACLALAPASFARADVWLLDVLTLRPEAPFYQAQTYVGALELLARRHGGVRVEGAVHAPPENGQTGGRIVGLWRFNDIAALDALLADPWYRALADLQDRTFDPAATRSLDRQRALSGNGE